MALCRIVSLGDVHDEYESFYVVAILVVTRQILLCVLTTNLAPFFVNDLLVHRQLFYILLQLHHSVSLRLSMLL